VIQPVKPTRESILRADDLVTEPSAVAPDAKGNSINTGSEQSEQQQSDCGKMPLASGATALGSVIHPT